MKGSDLNGRNFTSPNLWWLSTDLQTISLCAFPCTNHVSPKEMK